MAQKFFRTTVEKDHYHVFLSVLLKDGEFMMVFPAKDGHDHEIQRLQTGFMLTTTKGHTHRIDYQAPMADHNNSLPFKTKKSDDEVVGEVINQHEYVKDISRRAVAHGQLAEDFYRGDQWSLKDRQKLRKDNRAVITKNKIEPKIDALLGIQKANLVDIKYLPIESSDQVKANIGTFVMKHILERNGFPHKRSKFFKDLAIPGRGAYEIYIDFDSGDFDGEIKIKNSKWDAIYLYPHEEDDLSDCPVLIRRKLISRSEAERSFPDIADEISIQFHEDFKPAIASTYVHQDPPEFIDDDDALFSATSFFDTVRKNILVVDRWSRENFEAEIIMSKDLKVREDITLWDKEAKDAVKKSGEFNFVKRTKSKIRHTVIVGHALALDELDKTHSDLPFIIQHTKKDKNYFWGKVYPMVDNQREINKRHSQNMDIVSRMANYNEVAGREAFGDEKQKAAYNRDKTKSGALLFADRPELITPREGIKVPSEVIALGEISERDLTEISGVNPELQGQPSNVTSNVGKNTQIRQSLISNEILFEASEKADIQLGKKLWPYIKRFFSAEKIARLINSSSPEQVKQIFGEGQVPDIDEDLIAIIMSDDNTIDFDVKVAQSPYSRTLREEVGIKLGNIAATNPEGVPPELHFEFMDLPIAIKTQIINSIKQAAQQRQELEKMKLQVELDKTQIANQGKQQQQEQGGQPPTSLS